LVKTWPTASIILVAPTATLLSRTLPESNHIIERLNKEYKRRTKSMEILAGETACYRLLAFISLKMELHWRSNPIGKVLKNLPFFHEMAYKQFTQTS